MATQVPQAEADLAVPAGPVVSVVSGPTGPKALPTAPPVARVESVALVALEDSAERIPVMAARAAPEDPEALAGGAVTAFKVQRVQNPADAAEPVETAARAATVEPAEPVVSVDRLVEMASPALVVPAVPAGPAVEPVTLGMVALAVLVTNSFAMVETAELVASAAPPELAVQEVPALQPAHREAPVPPPLAATAALAVPAGIQRSQEPPAVLVVEVGTQGAMATAVPAEVVDRGSRETTVTTASCRVAVAHRERAAATAVRAVRVGAAGRYPVMAELEARVG